MNETARAIVEALRHIGKPVDVALADCSSCPMQDYPHTMAVDCGENCPGVLMLMAADLIEVVIAKLETTTRERDALKEDILRAQDKANDMQIELLDGEVHPTCDYSLYSALCDALSDVVAWENKELLEDEP